MHSMDQLIQLLETKGIRYATPQSPDYGDLHPVFIVDEETLPAVVVRPRCAEDVAALVSFLAENDLPFTVRGGGHDMFGRAQIHGGVTIDMRSVAHVHVDSDSQTARVGGGVISMDLLRQLQRHGVTTPHPVTPTVGLVGWAIHGGYGLLSTMYGLGADQIVGAQVVDSQGRVCEADETMLTAIRGAGGVVGVIVELTIKVYPVNQILAGIIFYESRNLAATIRQYSENYQKAATEGIPSSLSIERFVVNGPTGKMLMAFFLWASSDLEEGQAWLAKASSWAPLGMSTVAPTTIADFNEASNALVPKKAYGAIASITFKQLTPEVIDVIVKHAPLQPMNQEVLFGIHEIRAEAPTSESLPSMFITRQPHFLIEIIPITSSPADVEHVLEWAREFHGALMRTDSANILARYLPFTPAKEVDLQSVYGDRLETLREIKHEYDPQNRFKHGLVQL